MHLSDGARELMNILIMGFATLFLFTGYDTQAFVVESVLHSVHRREPDRIDGHAGYYGQTVLYAAYTVSTLFAPWICYKFGSRMSLFIGSVLFSIFLAGFFFLNSMFYYSSEVLLGIGFALYYCGQGAYVSEHSTNLTISRNSVLMSAIGNSSMLMGGLVLAIISTFNHSYSTGKEDGVLYRSFSNQEILLIYGILFVVSFLSNIGFFILPKVPSKNSLAMQNPNKHSTLKNQIALLGSTVSESRFLLLIPFFLFYGCHIAFWLLVYPTTFSFSNTLADNPMIVAFYSVMIGIGNIIIGFFIHTMSKSNPSFGLMPTMMVQLCSACALYVLTILYTPPESSMHPTNESGLLFDPRAYICLMVGLLHGMVDCSSCTMRSIICTIALPERRLQFYSAAKLFQSLATCLASFLAAYLNIYHWVILLAVLQIASAVGFYLVTRLIEKKNRIQAAADC
ncbi:unnamed protein product [Auanema sp. JU1783]|nr:unnamed protein product [Auanema sp. JU1783]